MDMDDEYSDSSSDESDEAPAPKRQKPTPCGRQVLAEIEQQLEKLDASGDVLADNLAVIADVLSNAGEHLWLEDKALCLDRLYVVHEKPSRSAPSIVFKEIHTSAGRQATLKLLSIPSQ